MITSEQIYQLAFLLDLRVKSEDTSLSYNERDFYRRDYFLMKAVAIEKLGEELYNAAMESLEELLIKK